MDFPPKIEIFVENVPKFVSSAPLCLCVEGMNEEIIFKLKPGKFKAKFRKYIAT